MNLTVRIPRRLELAIRSDLGRPHPFAAERVGFVFARHNDLANSGNAIVLAESYEPVEDDNYIDDPTVGARINATVIRNVMQRALSTGEGAFHVHLHNHSGIPRLSPVDREELRPLMSSIRNASPNAVHGLFLLSSDAAYCEGVVPGAVDFEPAQRITCVGFPTKVLLSHDSGELNSSRFSRQCFLGPDAQLRLRSCHVGVVGLGGGGSHIVQQLAHLGFASYALFDSDTVESSNLNRLVGATNADAERATSKIAVAARIIRSVNPDASVTAVNKRWQEAPDALHGCDLIFGCVDSYSERRELEVASRRFLIPYIDIGLDVTQCFGEAPQMAGQVILSMPGEKCMFCLGFLTADKFAREAERYGAAGPQPQVVWANGVLASSAIGIAVDLVTDWSRSLRGPVYLSYDSNTGNIRPHKRLNYLQIGACEHYPSCDVGAPSFRRF